MFCHTHISLTGLSARTGRATSHLCPWDLSYLILSPDCLCCHHFCLWCSPFPQAKPVNKMSAPPNCSCTAGTQAFAAQPEASPALAAQGKHVWVWEVLYKLNLKKMSAAPCSCDLLVFGLYLPLPMPLQFLIWLVSGSSSVIDSLGSFTGIFPSSVWIICNLTVQRNEGQVSLESQKVHLKFRVHPMEHNDFLNIFKPFLFFTSLKF